MSRRWLLVVTHTLAALTGVFLAKAWSARALFEWDNRVSITSGISILLTVAISAVFFRGFERQKYSDKLKKDAILDNLKGALTSITDLESLIEKRPLSHAEVVRAIQKVRRELRHLVTFCARMQYQLQKDRVTAANQAGQSLNRLLTLTPVSPKNDGSDPLIKNGDELQLSRSRLAEVDRAFLDLKREVLELQIQVITDVD